MVLKDNKTATFIYRDKIAKPSLDLLPANFILQNIFVFSKISPKKNTVFLSDVFLFSFYLGFTT